MSAVSDLPTGWCEGDSFAFFDRMVEEAPSPAIFVEVGVALGRSAVYMARQILRSRKAIAFYVVDPWEEDWYSAACPPFLAFVESVRKFPVELPILRPLRLPSVRAARIFDDRSVRFIFIDGGHDQASVAADLAVWTPKICPGGVISGHDYHSGDHPGVTRAVDEFFFPKVESVGATWWRRVG